MDFEALKTVSDLRLAHLAPKLRTVTATWEPSLELLLPQRPALMSEIYTRYEGFFALSHRARRVCMKYTRSLIIP